MRRSVLALVLVGVWTLCCPNPSQAQNVYRVGVLIANDAFMPAFDGFKAKMEELAYREGQNIKYSLYNAEGDRDVLPRLAGTVVQEKPDLIIASSATAAAALEKATKGASVPVVFLSVADPLQFAESYASSGNNFTGISTSTIDLTEKRIELLQELVPGIKKAISLHHSRGSNYEANLHATRKAAQRLGLNLAEITVASPDELRQRAPVLLTRKVGEAIIYPPDLIVNITQKEILPQVLKEKLPSIAARVADVHAGAMATYAADYYLLGQQGAAMADKILKGTSPRDLPIEQALRLKLVLNMKIARAIGLNIPRQILLRADEIIE